MGKGGERKSLQTYGTTPPSSKYWKQRIRKRKREKRKKKKGGKKRKEKICPAHQVLKFAFAVGIWASHTGGRREKRRKVRKEKTLRSCTLLCTEKAETGPKEGERGKTKGGGKGFADTHHPTENHLSWACRFLYKPCSKG